MAYAQGNIFTAVIDAVDAGPAWLVKKYKQPMGAVK